MSCDSKLDLQRVMLTLEYARWVDEMKEIAETFHTEGGFERDMFDGVSEVYRFVADETGLGKEKTEDRRVGKTPEDVARLMGQGLERKKEKVE